MGIAAALRRETSECDRCRNPVVWAVTAAGERQPLDPSPLPAREATDRDVAVHRDHLGTLRCRVPSPDYPAAVYERIHRPHHATCQPPADNTGGDGAGDLSGGQVVSLDAFRRHAARSRPVG